MPLGHVVLVADHPRVKNGDLLNDLPESTAPRLEGKVEIDRRSPFD
jgi:hypothetical protein